MAARRAAIATAARSTTRSSARQRCSARPKRPLMVVGGGAQHAGAEVHGAGGVAADAGRRRPDGLRRGRFAPSAQHHRCRSRTSCGAKADVVLAVGTRLQIQQMNWGLDADLKIIRIDIDPEEIDRFAPARGRHRRRRRASARALLRARCAASCRAHDRAAPSCAARSSDARSSGRCVLAAAARLSPARSAPRCPRTASWSTKSPRSATPRASAIRSIGRAPSSRRAIRARSAGATRPRSASRWRGRTAGRVDQRRRRLHVQRAGDGDRGASRHRRRRGGVQRRRLRQRAAHRRRCATATG